MGDARQFAIEIDRELAAAEEQWRLIIRNVALEALKRVVDKTPVGNPSKWKSPPPPGYVGGRARMNWYVQIGGAGEEITSEVDETGSVAVSRGSQVIGQYQNVEGFPSIVLYNNLPYIGRLEDGYSDQAPNGMVSVTVAELQSQFR